MTLFITYGWPTIILCLLIITARSNVAAIIPVLKCTACLVFLVFSKYLTLTNSQLWSQYWLQAGLLFSAFRKEYQDQSNSSHPKYQAKERSLRKPTFLTTLDYCSSVKSACVCGPAIMPLPNKWPQKMLQFAGMAWMALKHLSLKQTWYDRDVARRSHLIFWNPIELSHFPSKLVTC